MQALRDEGHDPEEYIFEISVNKGKPVKLGASPSKAFKEAEKSISCEEEFACKEELISNEENSGKNNKNPVEDKLIIKDEIENDCFEEVDEIGGFEEVDRIGEIEKEVSKRFSV